MDWKKIGKKLLFPPVWLLCLLAVATAAMLATIFCMGLQEHWLAICMYVPAFYTLCVWVIFCWQWLPGYYRRMRQAFLDHPFGNHFATDPAFRIHISLFSALAGNLLYVALHILLFFLYRSMWFICLTLYYSILSAMRLLLTQYVRRHKIGRHRRRELRRAIGCSVILLLLNFFLSGAVLMMLYVDKGYDYPGILIYVMATYTFYTTTQAIVNLIRYRKYDSPIMDTAKVISVAAALVSMLNLETAMFAQFGQEMDPNGQKLMIMLTGAGVALSVSSLSVWMILRCRKQQKQLAAARCATATNP